MLILLQYNLYLILFSRITLINCVNFSQAPTKPICLLVNHSPTTYLGNSNTYGTKSILFLEVFPKFLTKCILCLLITMYGINTTPFCFLRRVLLS